MLSGLVSISASGTPQLETYVLLEGLLPELLSSNLHATGTLHATNNTLLPPQLLTVPGTKQAC